MNTTTIEMKVLNTTPKKFILSKSRMIKKVKYKKVNLPTIEYQPIGINLGDDASGISANQSVGITQPPARIR